MPTGINIIWTNEQINDIVDRYTGRQSLLSISQIYNVSAATIGRLVRRLGSPKRKDLHTRIFSQNELNNIKHQYLNTPQSFENIAKAYHVSLGTLLRIFRENKIPTKGSRKHALVNENYFEKIDTANKAYFLGLISADGFVLDKEAGQKIVGISLQYRDGEIIHYMKDDMLYEGKVYY